MLCRRYLSSQRSIFCISLHAVSCWLLLLIRQQGLQCLAFNNVAKKSCCPPGRNVNSGSMLSELRSSALYRNSLGIGEIQWWCQGVMTAIKSGQGRDVVVLLSHTLNRRNAKFRSHSASSSSRSPANFGWGNSRYQNTNHYSDHHNHRQKTQQQPLTIMHEDYVVEAFMTAVAYIAFPYFGRVAKANRSWEERLQRDREKRLQRWQDTKGTSNAKDDPEREMSNLDFYAESIKKYPSMYGEDGILAKQREKRRRREIRKQEDVKKTRNDDNEMVKEDEEREGEIEDDESDYPTEEEIQSFENEYGIDYDPYIDEPYYEDELPSDTEFYREPVFGDRIYEDGEVFFRDGDKYYRRGSRPRSKFFWQKK